ncbi:MAG: type I-B CRISPR-associated protein Cas5b [Archaeoglobaceae archaeon]
MREAVRVKIISWTASFRYPTFQAGYQPSLKVPPLSTIQGLLSAAKGEIVSFSELEFFGYIFISNGFGIDLERIYPLGKEETDVIKREVLFDNELFLYLPLDWGDYFKKPKYQLLLGRSCDLATVEEIKKVVLEKKKDVPIGGTIVPINAGIPGLVHALPVEFDYSEVPRRAKAVKPFIAIPFPKTLERRKKQIFRGDIFYDPEIQLGVWLYEGMPGKI